jgi:hypothetical protein
MATHKAKVIGPFPVNGANPGETTTLDDEVLNVAALVESGHVELVVSESQTSKPDLQKQAAALGLDTDGTKAEIAERIREAQETP